MKSESKPSHSKDGSAMKARRRIAFTREGWQYLVIFLLVFFGALINDINLLLILGGMLACPLLLSHHLAKRTLGGLAVQRRLPRAICAGDLLVVHVSIANTRRRLGGWILAVEDTIQRLGNGSTHDRAEPVCRPERAFPYVAARQTASGDYRGRLTQRGRYSLGPIRVSTRFPFGLFRYWFNCGTTATLTVMPRLGRLTQSWRTLRHESFAGSERREHRPGIDGDFYGLRPWQRGDSRRWIHWRTTARTGEVMVRQFEQPHSRDAAIVLNLWQPQVPDDAQQENVELAVSFAATLAAELCRSRQQRCFPRSPPIPSRGLPAAPVRRLCCKTSWSGWPLSRPAMATACRSCSSLPPRESSRARRSFWSARSPWTSRVRLMPAACPAKCRGESADAACGPWIRRAQAWRSCSCRE